MVRSKKKLVHHIITATLISAFTLFIPMKANGQEQVVDQVVAVVGDNIILQSEIEEYMQQMRAQGFTMTEEMRCELLEDFLVQKLLVTQAEIDSVEISEADVEMEMNNRMQFFVRQIGSEQKLEDYFSKSIFEIREDLREPIREQMLTQRMQMKITENVRVTPSEVKEYYNSVHPDSIPMIPSKVEIRQIVKYPTFTETEEFRVVQRLNDMRQRIISGESSFSAMAAIYSHDEGTARRGGELGFVSRSDLDPEFADVVFSLKEDRISQVFQSGYGYHIAQVIDRRDERVNVRHILIQPEIDEREKEVARNFLDSISAAIASNSISFREAAMKYSDDEKTNMSGGLMVNPQTGGAMFEIDQLNPDVYEAIKDLSVGEMSEPVEIREQRGRIAYKVFYLSRQTAPQKANLKDNYDVIKEMALEEKEQKVLMNWIGKRQEKTFIRIMDDYKNCNFSTDGWFDN